MKVRNALLLVGALTVTGCVAADADGPVAADGTDVLIELDDIRFEPDRIVVEQGQTITAELHNVGGIVHDLRFDDGWDSGMIDPGRRDTVELGPFETTTTGWCSVPGHRNAGMELEVVVE